MHICIVSIFHPKVNGKSSRLEGLVDVIPRKDNIIGYCS
jgi:hypothetical protein